MYRDRSPCLMDGLSRRSFHGNARFAPSLCQGRSSTCAANVGLPGGDAACCCGIIFEFVYTVSAIKHDRMSSGRPLWIANAPLWRHVTRHARPSQIYRLIHTPAGLYMVLTCIVRFYVTVQAVLNGKKQTLRSTRLYCVSDKLRNVREYVSRYYVD